MRLSDRLFAFWRLPAWTDAVQVLLWLLGWAAIAGVLGLLGAAIATMFAFSAVGSDALGPVVLLAFTLQLLSLLVSLVGASWFVSEAYRGWRNGHPHGRQWAVLIGGLLLLPGVTRVFQRPMPLGDGWSTAYLAYVSIAAACGVALLVAVVTTKPPSPPASTAPG
ncbi:MAG: hypothetical protein ACYC2H_03345 [Thermoplasmatota archaeon]